MHDHPHDIVLQADIHYYDLNRDSHRDACRIRHGRRTSQAAVSGGLMTVERRHDISRRRHG